jgi:hypothetical protein
VTAEASYQSWRIPSRRWRWHHNTSQLLIDIAGIDPFPAGPTLVESRQKTLLAGLCNRLAILYFNLVNWVSYSPLPRSQRDSEGGSPDARSSEFARSQRNSYPARTGSSDPRLSPAPSIRTGTVEPSVNVVLYQVLAENWKGQGGSLLKVPLMAHLQAASFSPAASIQTPLLVKL